MAVSGWPYVLLYIDPGCHVTAPRLAPAPVRGNKNPRVGAERRVRRKRSDRPQRTSRTTNGCAERFIRTLKENLLWVSAFRTVEELRLTLIAFRRTYNENWLIQRHGHRSPAQFRRDQMDTIPMAA